MKSHSTHARRYSPRSGLLAALAVGVALAAPAFSRQRVTAASPAKPPKGALVLFDGADAAQWRSAGGNKPCPWKIVDGALVVGPGNIETAPKFTDFQLHVEFNIPAMPDAHSQGKGNSGVYLQGLYEIQVLDSFNNETYANGMCGAIYGQTPPLINACKPAGQWQTYDITYHAPRFGAEGSLLKKPRATVFQNAILIHDDDEIDGATVASGNYDKTQAGPIVLQDHGCKVTYRNIWIKRL